MADLLAEDAPAGGGPRTVTLPGGLEVACQTTTEARFFYEDIFEKRIYHRRGISLEGVRTVFDVGANIGLFSLFIHRWCPEAEIFAFEPAPALFEIYRHNTATHGTRARAFNCALAERTRRAPFTFYVNSSGMSSLYADRDEERRALEGLFDSQVRQGRDGAAEVMRHSEDLLEERLRAEVVEVEVRTLSEVIAEHGVERVDLLKIDVQKAEAEVIAGISEDDWPKIRQLVAEVHDVDGRAERLGRELEGRGFSVVAEQDDHYEGSEVYNLYAVREPRSAPAGGTIGKVASRAARLRAALEKQESSGSREPGSSPKDDRKT